MDFVEGRDAGTEAATVLNYLVKNARISQFLDATGDYLGKVGVKVL
jgi:hypothetical protein